VPLANVVDSLDKHQGASTAILTAALVLVTIYYAVQNRRMVMEMKRARDSTILPKLALDFHRLGPTAMTLAIKNVGPGAALDVDVRVVWEPVGAGQAPEHRWRRNVFAPGEQSDFMPPGNGLNGNVDSLPAAYARVRLIGTMKDGAGNAHEVMEAFENLAEWREVLGGARQRYVTADPERRVAEELSKKFEQPLRDLRRSVDGIAAALAALAPEQPQDERE
jgi:hypothetical protein